MDRRPADPDREARLERGRSAGWRVLLAGLFACAAIAAAAFATAKVQGGETGRPHFEVETFRVPSGSGYGYRISNGGRPLIHQPHLPGVPGRAGFTSEGEARRVAALVIRRMRAGTFPPAISLEDLDSLCVRTGAIPE